MEKIKQLIAEYEIRFHDTDLIDPEEDHFETLDALNRGRYNPEVSTEVMWNRNGIVWTAEKGWATALLTKKPDKWVVEKDESHPMWEEFKEWLDHNWGNNYFLKLEKNQYKYFTQNNASTDLYNLHNHQYLTLDQWAKFFLDEPKVGDIGWFWIDDINDGIMGILTNVTLWTEVGTNIEEKIYEVDGGAQRPNYTKLSSEFETAYEKEMKRIKNL